MIYDQLLVRKNYNEIIQELGILSSLINMFGKFGDLKKCEEIFEIVRKDLYLIYNKIGIWNVMINAYGINGDGLNAKRLFHEMREKTNIKVDSKGYVTTFNALSHGGDVNEAKRIWYHEILDTNIKYHMLVVSSFVDCLARNGSLYEAYDVIHRYEKMEHSQFCEEMWLSLLNGCKIYKNDMFQNYVSEKLEKKTKV